MWLLLSAGATHTINFSLTRIHTHTHTSFFLSCCLFTSPRWDIARSCSVFFFFACVCLFIVNVCQFPHSGLSDGSCFYLIVFFFMFASYKYPSWIKSQEITADPLIWELSVFNGVTFPLSSITDGEKGGTEVLLIESDMWGKWGENRLFHQEQFYEGIPPICHSTCREVYSVLQSRICRKSRHKP